MAFDFSRTGCGHRHSERESAAEELARTQFELAGAFGVVAAGFFTVVPAAGLGAVPVLCTMLMWLIFTGRNGLSFEGSLAMRAICFTSVTLASSHWPKIV